MGDEYSINNVEKNNNKYVIHGSQPLDNGVHVRHTFILERTTDSQVEGNVEEEWSSDDRRSGSNTYKISFDIGDLDFEGLKDQQVDADVDISNDDVNHDAEGEVLKQRLKDDCKDWVENRRIPQLLTL